MRERENMQKENKLNNIIVNDSTITLFTHTFVIFNAYCYFLDQENNPAACATGPHVLVQQLSVINEQREIPECDQSAY